MEIEDRSEDENWLWVDKHRFYDMSQDDVDDWMKKLTRAANDLKEMGYAVIENVLTPDECQRVTAYTKEWTLHQEKYALSYAKEKLEKKKLEIATEMKTDLSENNVKDEVTLKTKEKEHSIHWAGTHHIVTAHGYNSSKIAREMRRHPMVCSIFRSLYGNRCDLLSSQDRVNMLSTGKISKATQSWAHVDLNVRKNLPEDRTIVLQAYVSVTPQPTDENDVDFGTSGNRFYVKKIKNEDGTVSKIGTHVGFSDRWKHRRTSEKTDWYKLLQDDIETLKKEGFELVKPSHGPGAMVLWDSRCVHDPFAERVTPTMAKKEKSKDPFKRLVYYVCLIPSPIFCKERANYHDYTPVKLYKFGESVNGDDLSKRTLTSNAELCDTIEHFFDNEKTLGKNTYLEFDATRHTAYPKYGSRGKGSVFSREPNKMYNRNPDPFVEVGESSSTINVCPFVKYYDVANEKFKEDYIPHKFDSVWHEEPTNAFERRTFGFELFQSEKFERDTLTYMLSSRIDADDREETDDLTYEYLTSEEMDINTFNQALNISDAFSDMLKETAHATRLKMCHNFLPLENVTLNALNLKKLKDKNNGNIDAKESKKLTSNQKSNVKITTTTLKRKRSKGIEKDTKKTKYKGETHSIKDADFNEGSEDELEVEEDPSENDDEGRMYKGQVIDYDYQLRFRNLLI